MAPPTSPFRASLLLWVGACIASSAAGCGGGTAAAPPPAEPAQTTETAPPPTEDEASEPAPGPEASTAPAAEPEAPAPAPEGRKVVYRVTPGGLVIEVDGVELKPKAKASRRGAGWVIDLDVAAKAKDDRMHRLLSPKNGPLMIAARVSKGGDVQEHEDTREGDEETIVTSGDSVPIKRSFPTDPKSSFGKGTEVTLHVGLWGLGADADERRPVRKLFVIKMVVDAGTPQAVISPPEG